MTRSAADRSACRRAATWGLLVSLVAVLVAITVAAAPQGGAAPARGRRGGGSVSADQALFVPTRVATIELRFTVDQYAALAPHRPARARLLPGQSRLLGPDGGHNGYANIMGVAFDYVHADVVIDGQEFKNVGARYKGNGTYLDGRGKPSYKIDFNRYVKGQKIGPLKTINLHNGATDPSQMNEVLAFRLYRDAGLSAPRTAYARVFLSVAGRFERRYVGLYSLVENPDEPFLEARGLPVAGAAIFKPVIPSLFTDFGPVWANYQQTYDPKTDLTDAQRKRVMDFSRAVTHATDAEFAKAAAAYLDLPSLARYLAVAVYLADLDGMLGSGQNYYMYLDPRTNRFSFSAWDQDRSFGNHFQGSLRSRIRLDLERPWEGENRFLERLFALPAFSSQYRAAFVDLARRLFVPERFVSQVDALAAAIRPAVADESGARLSAFDRAVAGTSAPSVKQFTRERSAFVATALR